MKQLCTPSRYKQPCLYRKIFYLFFFLVFNAMPGIAAPTNLVISQAYGGGGNSGSVYKNDFIELFNPTASSITATNWSVQYTSSTGTTWTVTTFSGTIAPGQYFLIQQAAGTGGTTNLPTPDAIGTTAMGGTGFKVALVNNNTALTGSCPTGANIVDFVGCGATANCNETANAPAPSNSNSIIRAGNGCTDNDNNSTDFAAALANPRNSASPLNVCSTPPTKLAITSISPASPTENTNFSVTVQSQDAGNTAKNVILSTDFTLSVATGTGALGGTITGTITAGTNTVTLTTVTYNVAESGVSLTATQTAGDPLTAGTSSTFTVQPLVVLDPEPTVQSAITIGTVTSYSAEFNFSGGDGASRILVVSPTNTVTYIPTDGFGPTGVNSHFPSASSVGGGARIVYAGSGNTVTVTGLNSSTLYHAAVFEYNGSLASTNYLQTSPGTNSTTTASRVVVPVPMASFLTYTENFSDEANWGNSFNGGTGANRWDTVGINATGTIPDGIKTTVSTAAFATSSTSSGVQRGSLVASGSNNVPGTIVLLTSGTPDNSGACAIDFLLDFTGTNAGTLSFDWAAVTNSTGDRGSSLRVYASTDNTTFTEITGAAVLDKLNGVAASGSIVSVALPASFNNSPTARLRFYNTNGSGGTTGSRAKISIDNVVVTASIPAPPDHLAITNISPASPIVNTSFSVTVQTQDPGNVASNVLSNTDISLQYTGGTGTLSGTVTATITAGNNSHTFTGLSYDVVESFTLVAQRTAGDVLTDGNSPITVVGTEPTIASTVTFGCITSNSMIINFTGGNGTSRIVVVKSGAISYTPTDGVASSGVDSDFGLAADQGSGDRIVYDGSGSSVTVTGLASSTTYSVAVYEYSGSGVLSDYLSSTPGTGSSTTSGTQSYATTGGTYTQNFNGLPSSGTFNTTGFGSGPNFLSECPVGASGLSGWEYGRTGGTNADLKFNADTGNSTTGAVRSYGPNNSLERALGSLSTGTTISNFGLVLTNNTSDVLYNVTISFTGEQWRNGGGTGIPNTLNFSYSLNGTNILSGTYTPVPALNFTSPTVSTTSSALDGNDPANQVALSATFALSGPWNPGQPLILRWDDPNDASNDHGLAVDDFTFTATPASAPITQDHDISFSSITTGAMTVNWINGDGANHLVVMNTTNSFTDPVDFNTYSANTFYTGTGYGSPNEQVVYNGSGNSVSVTNLNPNTEYWFRVYGYNASGPQSVYLTTTATLNPNSQFTASLSPPTQLAVLTVNGGVGVDVVKNQAFSVVVQSQDAGNVPQNVLTNTTVELSVSSGIGTLTSGNISGVIPAGQNSTTITGVIYDYAPDFSVILQADQISGTPALTFGSSASFNVLEGASALEFDTVPVSAIVNTIAVPIKVNAIRPDLTVDVNFNGPITIALASGTGAISGTTTVNAVNGIADFTDIVFDAVGPKTLTATSGALTPSTSTTIYITNAPVVSELVIPQYIGSKTTASLNNDRTPIAICIQIDNLVPNTAYNIAAGLDSVLAPNTSMGAGSIWSGTFSGSTLNNAFTTDGSGSSGPYWIYLQPSANASRFDAGKVHNLRLAFSTSALVFPFPPNHVSTKTITALDIPTTEYTATTADDGAFLIGSSTPCISGKYVLLYDNENGTGEPLYAYQARQMTPSNTVQSDLPTSVNNIFSQSGTSALGDYVGVIPIGANNPNGVRRIEVRNANNTINNFATDADGIWPGGANTTTVGRRGVVVITPSDAQFNTAAITSISSTPESCTGNDGTATVVATGVGTLTYLWTPSAQVTATATGLNAGNYSVVVSDDNGCTATASVSVAAPAGATITPGGPTSFCAPGSVTLTAGSGISWTWYNNNIATGDVTQSITVSSSGSYTVAVDDGLGCTATSAPVVVTVNTFAHTGVFYSESMGVPSGTTTLSNYTGWQNTAPVTYTATPTTLSDVRTTSGSSGYTGATGSGNIFFTSSGTRDFIISGINTLGYSSITLTFGLRRDGGAATDIIGVEYSTDGITYSPLSVPAALVNANTWYLITATGSIPNAPNLRLRFFKTSSVAFRLDDVKLTGGTTTTVDLAISGTTNLCPGASVRLTSNIPVTNPPSNLWSNAATTKSILVTTAGTYSVSVTDVNGCVATSAQVVVNTLVVDDGNACTTDACNSVLGTVSNTPVNTDDGNACTDDACDTQTGTITHDPIAGIDDGDPCTTDACDTQTGTITHTNTCSGPTFYAKVFIEGYYTGGTGLMINSFSGGCLFVTGGSTDPNDADYITISAMDATTYNLVESQTGILKTDGTINVTFGTAVLPNVSYYIKINQRNSLETWSAAPILLSGTSMAVPHDFTTSPTAAYGSNLVEVDPGVFAMYSGDISDAGTATPGIQDAIIESQDYGDMENAVYITLFGYFVEDITGDGIVESADYSLMENNVYFTRVYQRPF